MNCERAKDNLDDYLSGRLAEPMRVVLEHHVSECAPCRQELQTAQELGRILKDLPMMEPPLQFRANLLSRLPETPRRHLWTGRWSLGEFGSVSPVLKVGLAVMAAGLLFTQTPIGVQVMGPITLHFNSAETPSPAPYPALQHPLWLFSGSGSVPSNPTDRSLNILLQPATDLRHAKITLDEISDGLECLSVGVPTERGKVLWQGSLKANATLTIPLSFHATQPGVQRARFHLESDGKVSQELLLIPTGILKPSDSAVPLKGVMSATDALQQLAERFGVVLATDLTHQRQMETQLSLLSPGRAIQQLANQRNMQWKVNGGVYNLFTLPRSR